MTGATPAVLAQIPLFRRVALEDQLGRPDRGGVFIPLVCCRARRSRI
jgi:hypothetical protein